MVFSKDAPHQERSLRVELESFAGFNYFSTHVYTDKEALEKIITPSFGSFHVIDPILKEQRHGVLLNNQASLGLASRYIDSVITDDFNGGLRRRGAGL